MMNAGGGVPGDIPITMASGMQLGGRAPTDLPITMCNQPMCSQGDARLAALAAKLPNGAPLPDTLAAKVPAMHAIGDAAGEAPWPAASAANVHAMPALGDAAKPLAAIEDATAADASGAFGAGAVASEAPKDTSKLSALTAKIMVARGTMKDERAKALWACMYF
jgi:hypothetical protein